MKRCPSCDRTFEDSLRFCQTDGTPLVADGDTSGRVDDLLDVPAMPMRTASDREDSLMEIPGFDAPSADRQPTPAADFTPTPVEPPPSPFSTPEPESAYQSAKTEEIRSTFGQSDTTEWTPAPPAPVPSWQSQQSTPGAAPSSPVVKLGNNKNQTLAIVSLVLGIAGLTACCGVVIPSVAAVILGFMARGKVKADPAQYGGDGLALAGIITGIIGTIGGILVWVFYSAMILASIAGGGAYNY